MQAADRLVARTVRRGGPPLAVLAATAVLGALAQLALPFVLGRTVDSLVATDPAAGGWVTGCVVIVAGIVACETLVVWASGASSTRTSAWLRERILRHVIGVGPAMTRRFAEGDLATRMGLNAEEAGRAPEAVVTGVAMLLPSAGSLIALSLIDPWLAVAMACGLVLIGLVVRAFLRQTTSIASGYQEAQSDIAARLIDALAGVRTIAAAGTVDRESRRVLTALPQVRDYAMDLWRANARAGVQAAAMVPLMEMVVLAVGGLRLADGDITVGELYAAARYVVLGAGLSAALGYVNRLARARAAAGRAVQLLTEWPVAYGDRRLPAGPGTLEFRDVAVDGLADVDLTVRGGSAVAVVGRSGTGKTHLAALAGRLVDPARGAVLLDGVPLPDLSREELRRAVGYAFERPVLMGETLTDAIGLGLPAPDEEAVHAAARAACADAFVRRLPEGYATLLDDAPMSGGETQRIGLARAFAQGERLLILDDATSSLDTLTERQVSAALTGDLGGRTRLIVAHRIATAALADRVIWLDEGRIRSFEHHRVLWNNPDYRAVFQSTGEGP